MNIYFNNFVSSSFPILKEKTIFSLSPQQKKIAFIVSIAFAALAACYCAVCLINNWSIAKQSLLDIEDDSQEDLSASLDNIIKSRNIKGLLDYLVQNSESIEELNLTEFSNLSDKDLKEIVRFCPHLHSLDLSECMQITDQGLEHLKTLVALQSLDLYKCVQITDQGLEHLKTLVALRSLGLSGCMQITDQGLEHLKASVDLQYLNLHSTDAKKRFWRKNKNQR